jgi:hypothetical protein
MSRKPIDVDRILRIAADSRRKPWSAKRSAREVQQPYEMPRYPYKFSKLPYNLRQTVKTLAKPRDWQPKHSQKTLSRHIFSPYLNSYQMDLMFAKFNRLESGREHENQMIYLFIININTRYLWVYPLLNKDEESFINAFEHFRLENKISAITADREAAWFKSTFMQKRFELLGIRFYAAEPGYLRSMKIVDRVVKTIRDSGANLGNIDVMKKVVYYYNNSVHRVIGMTPAQMQANPELEKQWIRKCIRENDEIKQRQFNAGLYSYKPGNVLYLHLVDQTHALSMRSKRRRNFDRLGIFVEYYKHNVVVRPMFKNNDDDFFIEPRTIVVPVYFTRFCADDIKSIPANALYYCE